MDFLLLFILNSLLSSPGLFVCLQSEYVLSSTSSSPITDYANLPLIEDHSTFESSHSSTSSHNILPYQRIFPHNSTQQHFEAPRTINTNPTLREQNSIASTSSHDSIRSSVVGAAQEPVIVIDECPGRRFTKKAPPVPPKRHITVSFFYVASFFSSIVDIVFVCVFCMLNKFLS